MRGAGKRGLAEVELGFDAGHAVIEFDHLADQRVEFDFQTVEAIVDAVESRFYTIESRIQARFHTVQPCLNAVKSPVEAIIVDDIRQNADQYREGRYADRQIELNVRHLPILYFGVGNRLKPDPAPWRAELSAFRQ